MKFPGAPYGLKMACGENPKRVYGSEDGPSTRMGNVAGYRAAVDQGARATAREWDAVADEGSDRTTRPTATSQLETLAERARGARSWSTTTATAPTRWRR